MASPHDFLDHLLVTRQFLDPSAHADASVRTASLFQHAAGKTPGYLRSTRPAVIPHFPFVHTWPTPRTSTRPRRVGLRCGRLSAPKSSRFRSDDRHGPDG